MLKLMGIKYKTSGTFGIMVLSQKQLDDQEKFKIALSTGDMAAFQMGLDYCSNITGMMTVAYGVKVTKVEAHGKIIGQRADLMILDDLYDNLIDKPSKP